MTTAVPTYHALKVDAQKCIGCTHCMTSCPTEAIRIRNGLAVIEQKRCVDCGRCMRKCPAKAIFVEQDDLDKIKSFKYRVVLFPSVMIGQFPENYSEDQIYAALLKIGFTHVYEVEQPIGFLKESIRESCKKDKDHRPHISTFCPSIVRLIRIRYPSLAENLIHCKAPHDLGAHFALEQLMAQGANRDEIGLFYVTPCIAKMSAVKSPLGEKESIVNGIINMNELYNKVRKNISTKEAPDTSDQRATLTRDGILWSLTRGEARHFGERSMAIDGIHNVVKFLERLENEEVPDIDFLELRACDQSCAGGNLLSGNRFLTSERLERRAKRYQPAIKFKNHPIQEMAATLKPKLALDAIKPNPVFILDQDREKALEKMSKMQRIICFLPGIDCGACGAPNCQALAEDMVNQKAKMSDCVFLQQTWQEENKISTSKALKNMEKKWGKDRFKADCNKRGRRNEGF
ncbi:[Fe-Fe] hydrogenase large subunit C-terminal domain-containing protein [Mangrovibacterium diazotrophicum]|uniref:Iron only hydrogenase large subunit-like protein n=1 Tax=Mangrovibacterium diazotrophicum TaxID=1261403 RepID=A0A419VXE4_9BACT|nr:[Fe-Fe] hydrogenase large subunit C-terminal domain-containing protein [Mangrovibacterium diazotrophicum]RKD87897.1 iron only hydrogenase large subunit-like protein [Mangrovibacterium diazotrophicum]